jgi:hypothetical protein
VAARPLGGTLYTPDAGPARRALERASARPLLFLHHLPRWLPPLALAALLLAGLALHGAPAAAALVVVAAFLCWLAALSWPSLSGRGRLLRAGAVAALLAAAVIQAVR